ncbi:MAG: hypothetical protein AB8B53_02705 [Flavobacteriales bacterium]
MNLILQLILIIHISAGFTSVFIFWLPMLTKKGSKLHKKSGKLYVYSMWIVTITAAILSIKNVIIGEYATAIFLGFISLITAKPLWHGISILRKGADLERIRKIKTGLNMSILAWAIFMLVYASVSPGMWNPLMYIFAILGFTVLPELIRGLKKAAPNRNKIQIHAIEMTTTAISAYTAFFAFGGREFFSSFLTGYLMIIPWVLPGVIGGIANGYFGRKYASKKLA